MFKYTFPDVQVFYTIKIDDVTIKSVENTDARTFKDVRVFSGDNFYEPADGSYSNLIWGINNGLDNDISKAKLGDDLLINCMVRRYDM